MFKNLTAGAHLSMAHLTEQVRAQRKETEERGSPSPANSPARFSGGRGDREEGEGKQGGSGRQGAARRRAHGWWGGWELQRRRRPRRPAVVEDEHDDADRYFPRRGWLRDHYIGGRLGVGLI